MRLALEVMDSHYLIIDAKLLNKILETKFRYNHHKKALIFDTFL